MEASIPWERLSSVAIFGVLFYIIVTQGFKLLTGFVEKLEKLCEILAELKEIVAGFKEVIATCPKKIQSNSSSSTIPSEKP